MATYTIVKFKNFSPLHIGTGKENYDFSASELHSDTISSAIASIRAQIKKGDDTDKFLSSFTVSSAFPFVGNSFFLPKPNGKIDVSVRDMGNEYASRKKLKGIRYIESLLWNKIISGEKLEVKQEQLQNEFLISETSIKEFKKPFKNQVNQRVSVDREYNDETTPFFFEWRFFNSDAGLYCFFEAPEELEEELKSLFEILGETGLGTDKNIGGGKFEVEFGSISIEIPENANSTMLLSLFVPTENEVSSLNLHNSRYDLLLRGGFMSGSEEVDFRHLRKKSIYMFNVGSIFKTSSPLTGKIVNLQPDWNDEKMHPVFRSGKPFVIPVVDNNNI